MKIILSFIAALAILALPACQTTGNLKNDLTGLWNSPNVQTALSSVETAAIAFAQKFITSHLGGTTKLKVSSPSAQSAIDNATASIAAKHPEIPKDVIHNIVVAKFAERL